jgi:hypothetical protein
MSGALEDERNALLERMHASRTTYRSELSHVEEQVEAAAADVFPRSETFRFVKRHPYYASLGLFAALSIMPRMPLRRAVKSGAVLAAGMLGSSAKTLVMRQVLPSMVRSLRSRSRVR